MTPSPPPGSCVVIVRVGSADIDPGCEAALLDLEGRGYVVWRVRDPAASAAVRDRMAAAALAQGYDELLWVDPDVAFDPADVERLRAHGQPVVGGLCPDPSRRGVAAAFLPGLTAVRLGSSGGLLAVRSCGLGFALIRRAAFEAVARRRDLPTGDPPGRSVVSYFTTTIGRDGTQLSPPDDGEVFCDRAIACGVPVFVDSTLRLWRVGPYRYGWEDLEREPQRFDDYTLQLATTPPPTCDSPPRGEARTEFNERSTGPARDAGRPPASPLPTGFPRVRAYVVTYPANRDSLELTLRDFGRSDWGEEPVLIVQPPGVPAGRAAGSATYKVALERALADGCDYAVILEDDVRVSRHLRHNLMAHPLVARGACDYLSLFVPDLIADPWERVEADLGYRLARPRYSGPNRGWEKYRVWGSQGYVFSAHLLRACVDRWDRLAEGQDSRVLSVCAELNAPLWYTAPCWVEHAPLRTAFATPAAYAPDFDPDFRLTPTGFRPPDGVPGWLTVAESRLLAKAAEGRAVLELGTGAGRSTVGLAQAATRVVTIDRGNQSEAIEWVRRFGLSDRVDFRCGDAGSVCRSLGQRFGLVFIDTDHDAASIERDIESTLPLLEPCGKLAFHDYPDPGWPDVRRVVDECARDRGWSRVGQVDYLGVFATR